MVERLVGHLEGEVGSSGRLSVKGASQFCKNIWERIRKAAPLVGRLLHVCKSENHRIMSLFDKT